MNETVLRHIFEAHYPTPVGVWWMGEHYTGTKDLIGSFRNASEWDAMWRGFMCCVREFHLNSEEKSDTASRKCEYGHGGFHCGASDCWLGERGIVKGIY